MDAHKNPYARRFNDDVVDASITEIRSCSRCRIRLGVSEEMLGMMHTCPECDYVFRAISVIPFGAKPLPEVPILLEQEEIVELRPAEIDVA